MPIMKKKRKRRREIRVESTSPVEQGLQQPVMNEGEKEGERGRGQGGGLASDVTREFKEKQKRRNVRGVETPVDLSLMSASTSAVLDQISCGNGGTMASDLGLIQLEKIQRLKELKKEAAVLQVAQHESEYEGTQTINSKKKRKREREVRVGSASPGEQRLSMHLPPPVMNEGEQEGKRGREQEGGSASDVNMEGGGGETPVDLSSMSASPSAVQAMKLNKMQRLEELKNRAAALRAAQLDIEKEAAVLSAEIGQLDVEGEDNCQGHSYDEFLITYNDRNIQFSTCGLKNKRNTCFLNVILHCFAFTRPFLVYLLRDTYGKECCKSDKYWCLLCAMRRYIRSSRDCNFPYYPKEIIHRLQIIGGQFVRGRQQDASEFMIHATRKMVSDFFANHGDLRNPVENTIHYVFAGVIHSQIVCNTCSNVSPNYSKMMDLALEIGDPAQSLDDCLRMFMAPEHIHDAKCSRCEKLGVLKQLSIYQCPNILTITLKKFQDTRKLGKNIHYPIELDITEYASSKCGDNMYDLYAVVIHVGATISSGHYICYVKNYVGQWLLLDDKKVRIVTANEVHDKDAYMLLYIRRTARVTPPMFDEEIVEHKHGGEDATAHEIIRKVDQKKKKKSTLVDNPDGDGSPFAIDCTMLHNKRVLFNFHADLVTGQMEKLNDYYFIAEDTDKEVILERIDKALEFYKKNGCFQLPTRGTNSAVYDKDLLQLCMVNKGFYLSKSSEKAKRMAKVLRTIRYHVQQGSFIQQRAIFYLHKKLFELKCHISDNIVNEVTRLIRCTRASLNVTVAAEGSIIGPIILYVNSHIEIDCWRCGTGGSKIPHEAYQINKIKAIRKVKFILILEKQTILSILAGLEFHRKYSCIMVTGSGQPDLATRALVYKLRHTFDVPIYGFMDPNPYGVRILCTYRYGSQTRAFDNLAMTVHDIKWIGVFPSDLRWKRNLSVLSEDDYGILVNLLSLPHVQTDRSFYLKLRKMLNHGLKADIETVLDYGKIEGYLSKRIVEMGITEEHDEDDGCDETEECDEDDGCDETEECDEDDGCDETEECDEDDGCDETEECDEDDGCDETEECDEDDGCDETEECDDGEA